ncbi:MAG: single-stranded DNA-binding protein [Akkermansiaceae bacterium]|nr:single-stranded DNA-binding protein [Akkermansiaceae bacterium]
METTEYNPHELAATAANSVLSSLGFTYAIRTEESEDGINLFIDSKEAAYLIGDDGDRLDDLQYLINRLVQAQQANAPRVRVDCNLYRTKSEAKLLRRARARAERVLQTGTPLHMEKLNAYQRRLVHQELADIPGIATESEDTESRFKRITISKITEPCE